MKLRYHHFVCWYVHVFVDFKKRCGFWLAPTIADWVSFCRGDEVVTHVVGGDYKVKRKYFVNALKEDSPFKIFEPLTMGHFESQYLEEIYRLLEEYHGLMNVFEFADEIKGGAIPREFITPIQKGVKEAMDKGVVAGYPLVDIKATVYDGSYHEVDSSEIAFKLAGSMAFVAAAQKANPVILEPIMKVEVTTPEQYMGDVIGDISSKRGQIQEMTDRGQSKVVRATVPICHITSLNVSGTSKLCHGIFTLCRMSKKCRTCNCRRTQKVKRYALYNLRSLGNKCKHLFLSLHLIISFKKNQHCWFFCFLI